MFLKLKFTPKLFLFFNYSLFIGLQYSILNVYFFKHINHQGDLGNKGTVTCPFIFGEQGNIALFSGNIIVSKHTLYFRELQKNNSGEHGQLLTVKIL